MAFACRVIVNDQAVTYPEAAEVEHEPRSLPPRLVAVVARQRPEIPVRDSIPVAPQMDDRRYQAKLDDFDAAGKQRSNPQLPGQRRDRREWLHAAGIGNGHVVDGDLEVWDQCDARIAGEGHAPPRPLRDLVGDALLDEFRRKRHRHQGRQRHCNADNDEQRHNKSLHSAATPSSPVATPAQLLDRNNGKMPQGFSRLCGRDIARRLGYHRARKVNVATGRE